MGFNDLRKKSSTAGTAPPSVGYGSVPTPIYRFLDENGDGTGNKNANGDYSSTPTEFFIQPPPGQVFRIERMMILIRDSQNQFYTDRYGDVGVLGNGIEIKTLDDSGVLVNLTDDLPVKTNGEWGKFCYDAEVYPSTMGGTDTYLRARWTFSRAGYPLRLVGDNNERLAVILNDDLTGLIEHHFHVQGYIEGTD